MLSRLLKKPLQTGPAYAKKPYIGREQLAFYQRLRHALPGCTFFPDIALASLLTPLSDNVRLLRQQQEKLNGRRLAYGVFNDTLELLCVIELSRSGGTYDEERTQTLALLEAAAITCFSWDPDHLPSSDQILRAMSAFTDIAPARFQPAANSIIPEDTRDNWTAARGPASFSLTMDELKALTPHGHIKASYPHIWERICLFCNEPRHLEQYLSSLSLQDRGNKRTGFPECVIIELTNLQGANARFIAKPTQVRKGWNDTFVNR
jgi:hypothetical protein